MVTVISQDDVDKPFQDGVLTEAADRKLPVYKCSLDLGRNIEHLVLQVPDALAPRLKSQISKLVVDRAIALFDLH